jgi:hypothetical protein
MSSNRKRMPDGSRVSNEDIRESVRAWTQEIAGKCRNYRVPVGVIVVVVPLDDPKPQWAHNLTPQGAQQLLRRVGEEIAVSGGGIAVAGLDAMPKA